MSNYLLFFNSCVFIYIGVRYEERLFGSFRKSWLPAFIATIFFVNTFFLLDTFELKSALIRSFFTAATYFVGFYLLNQNNEKHRAREKEKK